MAKTYSSKNVRLDKAAVETISELAAITGWSETKAGSFLVNMASGLISGATTPQSVKEYLDAQTTLEAQRRASATKERIARERVNKARAAIGGSQ